MPYTIKKITVKETLSVRHPVLRKGKPIESCLFDGDYLDSTFHLGIFKEDILLGVCTFLKNKHELLTNKNQYQLRGMAVLNDYQNLGIGHLVLTHGEQLLKNKNVEVIWCNAREKAANFYKKNAYKTIGTPLDILNIGKHFVMYKNL